MTGRVNPLDIPELLEQVLKDLYYRTWSRKSLVAAAQVNKLWFELATSIIWSEASFFDSVWGPEWHGKALNRMQSERKAIYAAKIKLLRERNEGFPGEDRIANAFHSQFKTLQFTSMRSVVLVIQDQIDGPYRIQYLVPSLRSIQILHDHHAKFCLSTGLDGCDYISGSFIARIQVKSTTFSGNSKVQQY